MKDIVYCSYCGAENKATATFCHKCGKKLTNRKLENTDISKINATEIDKKSIIKVVMLIVGILIIGIILIRGVHSFYLNHRSEQALANIAQRIAERDFGSDEVQVYYSKNDNTYTIKTLPNSATRSNLREYLFSYSDNQDDMNDLTNDYQDFINDIDEYMGSKYKKYYTCLQNPWDHSRVYIKSTGTTITYDCLDN